MRVCVLGANGFIGKNIMHPDWIGVSREKLNLLDQKAVDTFFSERWDVVIHCAASLDQNSEETSYKNILMFENVFRSIHNIGKLIYFSSGAARRGNPPTDPYGLSKWIIEKRIAHIPSVYCVRLWGCYGDGELPNRFSAVCKEKGHVIIQKDRYFDFIDVKNVKQVVENYIENGGHKFLDLGEKYLLSEWATKFGATYEIIEDGLGETYSHLEI